jgi:hypothetical protein
MLGNLQFRDIHQTTIERWTATEIGQAFGSERIYILSPTAGGYANNTCGNRCFDIGDQVTVAAPIEETDGVTG